MLLVNHLGPAEDVEVFHDIFLHISQGGDLGEKSCRGKASSVTDRKICTSELEHAMPSGPLAKSFPFFFFLNIYLPSVIMLENIIEQRNKININHKSTSQRKALLTL